jgi:hypothetical protein
MTLTKYQQIKIFLSTLRNENKISGKESLAPIWNPTRSKVLPKENFIKQNLNSENSQEFKGRSEKFKNLTVKKSMRQFGTKSSI